MTYGVYLTQEELKAVLAELPTSASPSGWTQLQESHPHLVSAVYKIARVYEAAKADDALSDYEKTLYKPPVEPPPVRRLKIKKR